MVEVPPEAAIHIAEAADRFNIVLVPHRRDGNEYGIFQNQFSNVVEWEEFRDDMIFWKWSNREIKKGSKLIIRSGQDAIF